MYSAVLRNQDPHFSITKYGKDRWKATACGKTVKSRSKVMALGRLQEMLAKHRYVSEQSQESKEYERLVGKAKLLASFLMNPEYRCFC